MLAVFCTEELEPQKDKQYVVVTEMEIKLCLHSHITPGLERHLFTHSLLLPPIK